MELRVPLKVTWARAELAGSSLGEAYARDWNRRRIGNGEIDTPPTSLPPDVHIDADRGARRAGGARGRAQIQRRSAMPSWIWMDP
jgi:hypothetical protein